MLEYQLENRANSRAIAQYTTIYTSGSMGGYYFLGCLPSGQSVLGYRDGIPQTIHIENGPQFISEAFAEYIRNIGDKYIKTTPRCRWPQANGIETN